jgi:creatinine amidohydrolase
LSVRLADLTFVEVQRAIERGAVAMLPVGATEAHGPHLPIETDVVIACETCRRAAPLIRDRLGLEALVMPPVAYALTDYAAPFAGTVSIPKEVVVPYLTEIVVSASRSGYRAVCLVNGHLEPSHRHALRDAADRARPRAACAVTIADPCDRRWVSRLTEEFQSGACHAGQYETSLLLAAGAAVRDHAHLPAVDIDLMGRMKAGLTNFRDMGAEDAYFGRPARASHEEGESSFALLAEITLEVVREALDDGKAVDNGKGTDR